MTDSQDYTIEALLTWLDEMPIDKLRFSLKAILISEKINAYTMYKTLELASSICPLR